MNKKSKGYAGEIRRSQYIYSYGPGAVVNVKTNKGTLSLCMGDLRSWEYERTAKNRKTQQVIDERILRTLQKEEYGGAFSNITHFRLPPVDDETTGGQSYLAGTNFPTWVLCPNCRSLYNLTDSRQSRDAIQIKNGFNRKCGKCSTETKEVVLVPTRFVVSCKKGHLDSLDYKFWLNKFGKYQNGSQVDPNKCEHLDLKLKQSKGSLSIQDLLIACDNPKCKASASLGDVFRQSFKCKGGKPWKTFDSEYPEAEKCDEKAKVFQRNSRSLWQRKSISALSIPPLDYEFPKKVGSYEFNVIKEKGVEAIDILWNQIQQNWEEETGMKIPYSQEELWRIFLEEKAKYEDLSSDIYEDEFKVFTSDNIQKINEFEKVMRPVPKNYSRIQSIIEVQKLKVVDALIGFSRNDGEVNYYNDLKTTKFLPAITIFGEGVFINFEQDFIDNFLRKPELKKEWDLFRDDFDNSDKRRTLLNTVSHCILKATSRSSGYSLTSLKQRLYCSEKMSGILIYTSSSDAEGTLGGLSRLAETKRIEHILEIAEKISQMCSNDPLCEEGVFSLDNGNNGSVCHSCLLVPETSCEFNNEYLSRGLLKDFWSGLRD